MLFVCQDRELISSVRENFVFLEVTLLRYSFFLSDNLIILGEAPFQLILNVLWEIEWRVD